MGDEETVIHTAGGEASGLQAEASFDEYDPSQAVQIDFPRSQDSDAQSFPHNSVIPNTLENTTSAPTSHVISSTKGPFEDDTADDRQSLSRSMSRASSQSSGPVEITTSHEHTQGTNKIVEHSGPEILAGANGVSDVAQPSSLNPISDSTSNVPSNSVVPNHVLVQNHVLDQSSTHPVENGITKSVTNLAAVIPDTGASSHNEITLKPSETLPAPTMTEVTAPNKLVPPTHTTAAPRARLPNDTIGILEDRIKEDPRGDLEAWLNLIAEHKKRGKHDDARATYDRFLTAFPSAVRSPVFIRVHQHCTNPSIGRSMGFICSDGERNWRAAQDGYNFVKSLTNKSLPPFMVNVLRPYSASQQSYDRYFRPSSTNHPSSLRCRVKTYRS